MGFKNAFQAVGERARVTFNVPVISGDYANERITFSKVGTGTLATTIREVLALIEGAGLTGLTLELWLPRVADASFPDASRTDADYTNSGLTPLSTSGAVRWLIASYPGAQIRAKSGGVQGAVSVSATAL